MPKQDPIEVYLQGRFMPHEMEYKHSKIYLYASAYKTKEELFATLTGKFPNYRFRLTSFCANAVIKVEEKVTTIQGRVVMPPAGLYDHHVGYHINKPFSGEELLRAALRPFENKIVEISIKEILNGCEET